MFSVSLKSGSIDLTFIFHQFFFSFFISVFFFWVGGGGLNIGFGKLSYQGLVLLTEPLPSTFIYPLSVLLTHQPHPTLLTKYFPSQHHSVQANTTWHPPHCPTLPKAIQFCCNTIWHHPKKITLLSFIEWSEKGKGLKKNIYILKGGSTKNAWALGFSNICFAFEMRAFIVNTRNMHDFNALLHLTLYIGQILQGSACNVFGQTRPFPRPKPHNLRENLTSNSVAVTLMLDGMWFQGPAGPEI